MNAYEACPFKEEVALVGTNYHLAHRPLRTASTGKDSGIFQSKVIIRKTVVWESESAKVRLVYQEDMAREAPPGKKAQSIARWEPKKAHS